MSIRPKRLTDPLPVKYGFIPESWFTFFYPKTGVTGPYVFVGSVGTYLLSKEIYVLEHEFYNSLSLIIIFVVLVKKFGKPLATYLDGEVENYAKELDEPRNSELNMLRDAIKQNETLQWQVEAQKMIIEAKRENILMQLEAVYRERLAHAYHQVKQRLDYHTQIDSVQRRLSQKHMAQWILSNVMKSITPDLEKATLQQCIKDLQALSAKA